MFLVIGEKPSVGMALAKILGARERKDGYLEGGDALVSWCFGHLAEYVTPEAYSDRYEKWDFADLPIIPEHWRLAVAKDKEGQFEILKRLFQRTDLEYVVNGCDAGREGELIFRRAYELSGSHLPVKRLWVSSMEDSAIREGFAHLKDGTEYANLCMAAICRAQADWLIGMNATRAFTTKYYKKLSVGRVQTPTLAMLVDRQEKIRNFSKEAYYSVVLTAEGLSAESENMNDEAACDELVTGCQGKTAVVRKLKKTVRKSSPPKLYDLTTLQREANRLFGYTAQETLKELQELYEARMVTYPRTDSQYITSDMEQTVHELLEKLPSVVTFLSAGSSKYNIGNIINNAKVTDHHALLPTKEAMTKEWNALPKMQKDILYLITQRLAQAVSPDYVFEETDVEILCGGHTFRAKGRRTLQPGFREIEASFRKEYQKALREENSDDDVKGTVPTDLYEGMEISRVTLAKSRHFTAPPQPYTEDICCQCGVWKALRKKGAG